MYDNLFFFEEKNNYILFIFIFINIGFAILRLVL